MSPKPGLSVTGYLPSLDLADWEHFIKPLSGSSSTLAIPPEHKTFDSRLLWKGQELGSLNINLVRTLTNCRWIDLPWLGATYSQESGWE